VEWAEVGEAGDASVMREYRKILPKWEVGTS